MNRAGFLIRAMLVLLAFVPVQGVLAQEGPSLIILVRHAEKAAVPGADPPLSEAGKARAKALGAVLANTRLDAIVTTTYARTFETADVVAKDHNLPFEKVKVDGTHIAAVAAAVKAKKGVVLVVGHSNTIPAIIAALGGPELPDICEAYYSKLFVLQPMGSNPASLTVANYGASDPENAPGCATMQVR